jgi:glucoside 3-dehydrogenase (cytochrome c) catalytic subunit
MPTRTYDVCIVGSGAGGGTLSAHLARRGVDVVVVEGGPKVNTRTAFNTHAMPYQFENRHIPTMKPGVAGFDSERSRGVGGKTMLWNAVAWRYSHRDFKGYSLEGAGADWPIDYPDLKPWYDAIENEVGVCGNRDGLEDLPDGNFLPPVPMKCSDEIIKRGAEKLGIKIIHVRKATLSVPKFHRPACHFCGNCMAGCDVVAKYNSADVHMIPALATGKLEILHDSVVRRVTTTDKKATGVEFVNRVTGAEGSVKARVVVVACACVQSVALLMMSDIANENGQLGKHFIPHFTGGVQAFLEPLIGAKTTNDEGFLDHAYLPSFMHNRKRDYARSFGAQFNYQNRRAVGWARSMPGMGAALKSSIKDRYPAFVVFSPYGEMLPNKESYIDLDPAEKDQFGLPAARRHVVWSENDKKIFADMNHWSTEILKSAGAEILSVAPTPTTNHEIGGARMGVDPRTSVVNANCQVHEVPNLYVVDASVFPSSSEKNPTLTIMALAARAADNIATRLKAREV